MAGMTGGRRCGRIGKTGRGGEKWSQMGQNHGKSRGFSWNRWKIGRFRL